MLLAGRIASSQMRCLPLTEVSDFAATAAMSKLCFVLVHKSPKTPRHGVSFFRRILTRFSSYLRTQRHTEAYRGDKCRSGTIVTMFLTPVVLSSLPSLSSPFYLSHNHIYIHHHLSDSGIFPYLLKCPQMPYNADMFKFDNFPVFLY